MVWYLRDDLNTTGQKDRYFNGCNLSHKLSFSLYHFIYKQLLFIYKQSRLVIESDIKMVV